MEQFDDATGRIGELCETVRTKLKGVSKLLELRHPDINRNELNAVLDDPFSSTSEDVVRKILDTILPKGGLVADYEGDTRLLPLLEALSSLWDAMYDVSGQP
jgi:hypothetical protein